MTNTTQELLERWMRADGWEYDGFHGVWWPRNGCHEPHSTFTSNELLGKAWLIVGPLLERLIEDDCYPWPFDENAVEVRRVEGASLSLSQTVVRAILLAGLEVYGEVMPSETLA